MKGCRPLTADELDRIKTAMHDTRDRVLLVLLATTGLRIQEALSIKVQDVLNQDRVTVKRCNTKGKISGRTVLLHPDAKAGIEALVYERSLKPEHYLFKSQKGLNRPIGRIQAYTRIKQAALALKLQGKVSCHSTRKFFAGQVYEALGKDLYKTCQALGHKHITSTAHYLSFKTEEVDAAVLALKLK